MSTPTPASRRASLVASHMRHNLPFTPGAGPNGGNFFLPWRQLKDRFARAGVELNTPDLNADVRVAFELHLNAQRHVDPAVPSYAFLYEDAMVRPLNADLGALARYRKVFTWNEELVRRPGMVRLDYPNDLTLRPMPGWTERELHCVLIASNKALLRPDARSLHGARVATIRAFEAAAPDRFELYGPGWDIPAVRPGHGGRIEKRINEWMRRAWPKRRPFPSYRGKVHAKRDVLDRARFCIAYENSRGSPGYLTEKIFDCFTSGCVPVYIGAPGWKQVIPAECCIDGDAFERPQDIVAYLDQVTPTQFAAYQRAMRDFLSQPSTQRFGNEHFCRVLVDEILADLGTT
jgi:hypothetical protein